MIMRTLLIDNYDSYTYNLYQLISKVNGVCPIVIRNNDYNGSWDECKRQLHGLYDNIVISPGPGHPSKVEDFGLCAGAIEGNNYILLCIK